MNSPSRSVGTEPRPAAHPGPKRLRRPLWHATVPSSRRPLSRTECARGTHHSRSRPLHGSSEIDSQGLQHSRRHIACSGSSGGVAAGPPAAKGGTLARSHATVAASSTLTPAWSGTPVASAKASGRSLLTSSITQLPERLPGQSESPRPAVEPLYQLRLPHGPRRLLGQHMPPWGGIQNRATTR